MAFFHTGLHPDYHRSTDTADKINYGENGKDRSAGFRECLDRSQRSPTAGPVARQGRSRKSHVERRTSFSRQQTASELKAAVTESLKTHHGCPTIRGRATFRRSDVRPLQLRQRPDRFERRVIVRMVSHLAHILDVPKRAFGVNHEESPGTQPQFLDQGSIAGSKRASR